MQARNMPANLRPRLGLAHLRRHRLLFSLLTVLIRRPVSLLMSSTTATVAQNLRIQLSGGIPFRLHECGHDAWWLIQTLGRQAILSWGWL
jgi:hypothetical protein